MKIKVIAILFLFTCLISGQTKQQLEVKDFFWGTNDTYKNANEIPETLNDESAVIIYKNENYDFHKFGKKITYTISIRKRIKLLDNAALKEFSDFSFQKRFRSDKGRYSWKQKGENIIGVKIIKSDASEIEIDVDAEAVEEDGEYKLAIPNLEVGDIIDYYFYRKEPFKSALPFGFDPVESTLGEEYPIMDYKLFFETENDFFINFNSYNGAPDLKEIATEKKTVRRYALEASNIKKNDFPRWFFPLIELPSYKFQVYFARSGLYEDMALAFLPEKETIIKKSVSQDEVLELYKTRFKSNGNIRDVKGFFKGKNFETDKEKVEAGYYYMRHYYLTRLVEAIMVNKAGIVSFPFMYYSPKLVFIDNQKQFIRHFTEFLKREKIDFEIIIAKNRYDGTIDDLLIEKNVNVLLKVKTETPVYVEYFGLHTSVNEFSPLIEQTDVYALTRSRISIDSISRKKLPRSEPLQNEAKKDIELTFNDDFSEFSISVMSSFKGHQKQEEQYNKLIFADYVHEDYERYQTKSFIDRVKNKKDKIEYYNKLDALITKLREEKEEAFKKSVAIEFEVTDIEDYTFKINETGRYGLDTYFTYTESFKGKNAFIKKAGSNYIVEIGKLITAQIDLTDEERTRTENVYMPYPRSYNNTISFNIPEGYTLAGLDKLNKSVNNKTGSFTSEAKIDENTLFITTSKQYKNNYESNENWSLMVDFLDEANQFTNEKILLKKI